MHQARFITTVSFMVLWTEQLRLQTKGTIEYLIIKWGGVLTSPILFKLGVTYTVLIWFFRIV
jgi:hypothetical protein